MNKELTTWIGHIVHLSEKDNKIRKALKDGDWKSLDAPSEINNYRVKIEEGKKNSFTVKDNTIYLSLSKEKKLSLKDLDAVAGGTAEIRGVSRNARGEYILDPTLIASSNDLDRLTVIQNPDGTVTYTLSCSGAECTNDGQSY